MPVRPEAGGIAIDLVPTIIILYLMLVFAVRSDNGHDPEGAITVVQLEEAQRALVRLRRPPSLPSPPNE